MARSEYQQYLDWKRKNPVLPDVRDYVPSDTVPEATATDMSDYQEFMAWSKRGATIPKPDSVRDYAERSIPPQSTAAVTPVVQTLPEMGAKSPGLVESLRRVGGGLASGVTGVSGAPTFATGREDTPGYRVGQIVGSFAPIGAALKTGRLLTSGMKAPAAVRAITGGAIGGGALETQRQLARGAAGEGIDPLQVPISAAEFAAFDAALQGGGFVLGKTMKAIKGEKWINQAREKYFGGRGPEATGAEVGATPASPTGLSPEDLEVVNRGNQTGFAGFGDPIVPIYHFEREIMRGVPDVPLRIGLHSKTMMGSIENIKYAIENPLRMMEKYGTKEIVYDRVRTAQGNADKATHEILKDFDSQVNKIVKFGSRGKTSARIHQYAYGQQKGGEAILKQNGIDKAPELTAEEMGLYETTRSYFEKMFVDLNNARRISGKEPFRKIENYFTFFRNLEGELQKGKTVLDVDPSALYKTPNSTPFRFAKKRIIDEYGPVDFDAFGAFRIYTRSAQKHIHLTPALSKVEQLLDGKYTDGFSFAEANPQAYNNIKAWAQFVAGENQQLVPSVPQIDSILRKLNGNISFAVLSYNPRSIGIQPTAIVNTATEIGSSWTMRGAFSLFKKEFRDMPFRESAVLRGRAGSAGWDVSARDALLGRTSTVGKVQAAVGNFGISPLSKLDIGTALASWNGAYLKAKELYGFAHKEAVVFADDVVERTQASAARHAISPIQRNALGKTLTAFQTFVINNWGYLTRDVFGLGNPKISNKEVFRKVMTYTIGAQVVNAVFEDGFGMRSPYPAPVREALKRMDADGSLANIALGVAKEFGEEVPLVGGAVRYGSSPFGATPQTVQDIFDTRRSTRKKVETLGKLLGVPGTTTMSKGYQWLTQESDK